MQHRRVLSMVLFPLSAFCLAALGACSSSDSTQGNPPAQPGQDASAQPEAGGGSGGFAPDAGTDSADPIEASNGDDAGPDSTVAAEAGSDAPQGPIELVRHTVDDAFAGAAFVAVADVLQDGKLDLVVTRFGSMGMSIPNGEVAIYTWGANLGDWSLAAKIIVEGDGIKFPNMPAVADVDDDGDLDVIQPSGFLACTMGGLGSACGALSWLEQANGQWIRHAIVESGSELFYHGVVFVDFDGDGVNDLVTVGEKQGSFGGQNEVVAQWFKGTTTGLRFETQPRVIGSGLGSFPSVADIDGDGDLDVASAEYFVTGGSFAWFERTASPSAGNPSGSWVRHVISSDSGPSIMLALVPNLFGDGVMRAVGSNHTNTAKWPTPDPQEAAAFVFDKPGDPTQAWTKHQITSGIVSRTNPLAPMAAPGIFGVGDIDGDGDSDILLSGDGDERVFWLEQKGPYDFEQHELEQKLGQAGGTKIVDLNGDGKNELVVTGYEANAVYVYERK